MVCDVGCLPKPSQDLYFYLQISENATLGTRCIKAAGFWHVSEYTDYLLTFLSTAVTYFDYNLLPTDDINGYVHAFDQQSVVSKPCTDCKIRGQSLFLALLARMMIQCCTAPFILCQAGPGPSRNLSQSHNLMRSNHIPFDSQQTLSELFKLSAVHAEDANQKNRVSPLALTLHQLVHIQLSL